MLLPNLMKLTKILSLFLILFSVSAAAQISFALKGHFLYPTGSASWDNIKNTAINTYNEEGKNKSGFNAGLSLKIDTPTAFFIMPELYYTQFSNKFTDEVTETELEAKSSRADLPVLLGLGLLGDRIGVFAGPVASYNLADENQFEDFQENAKNKFTVGYQFGAEVNISKIVVNARYEGAFTEDQREFVNNNLGNYTVRYDNRPSLFLVGLGYKF